MKPKDGRKALVVFSDGEDRGSKETLNDAIDAADRANVAVYTIYFKGEQERGWATAFPAVAGTAAWAAAGPAAVAEAIRAAAAVVTPAAVAEGGRRGGERAGIGRQEDHGEDCHPHRRPLLRSQEERQPRRHLQPDRRGAARPVPAHLHADKVDNEGGFHKIALKAKKDDLPWSRAKATTRRRSRLGSWVLKPN